MWDFVTNKKKSYQEGNAGLPHNKDKSYIGEYTQDAEPGAPTIVKASSWRFERDICFLYPPRCASVKLKSKEM